MRRVDWVKRLRGEIDHAAGQPFKWGRQDCCRFAARCVDAMTDSEWLAELDAAYADQRSALRFLVEEGGLQAAVTRRFGDPVPAVRAMRGDLVLLASEDGVGSLGICVGSVAAAVHTEHGVTYVPMNQAVAVWGVR